jgi:hypothetical protein
VINAQKDQIGLKEVCRNLQLVDFSSVIIFLYRIMSTFLAGRNGLLINGAAAEGTRGFFDPAC